MTQTNVFGVVKVLFPKQKRDVAFSLKCEKSLVTVVCLHEVRVDAGKNIQHLSPFTLCLGGELQTWVRSGITCRNGTFCLGIAQYFGMYETLSYAHVYEREGSKVNCFCFRTWGLFMGIPVFTL